jgi:phosphoribosylanthranilate isomerase
MRTRVKICGLTHPDDVRATLNAGADALGFVFAQGSKRQVSIEQAVQLGASLPPFVSKVGLFVDAPVELVERAIHVCRLDTVQFHGTEPPDYCAHFLTKAKVIKAFRVQEAQATLLEAARFRVDALLLDAYVPGQAGGTGATFDWNIARQVVQQGYATILAGGLDPSNAARAIAEVQPYALDVSSGVECSPGRKDPIKVAAFIHAAMG